MAGSPQPFTAGIHLQPAFDVIEVLPEHAADRLRALRQRASDAHAVSVPFSDIQNASNAKIDAERQLKRLTDHPHDNGFGLKPSDPRVIEATKTLDKATADFKRLSELRDARAAASQSVLNAKSNVENWLKDGVPHGTKLEVVETETPKPTKGESLMDAIERHRRRVRELRADLHRIESAPFPSSYCKQRAREQIEALAAQGAPAVGRLVEHDLPIDWTQMRVQSAVHNAQPGAVAFAEVPDAVALFAWTFKDQLIQRLDREIDAEADDKAALSNEVRQQRTAEVMGDLLAVERDESALVWLAQSQGLPVEHRADCSPLAILQLRLITAVGNGRDGPSSSWMHAFDITRR